MAEKVPEGSEVEFKGGLPAKKGSVEPWAAGREPGDYARNSGGGGRLRQCLWADHRGVPHVVFKPDWARHQKAAPFKRNDAMLEAMPIGVIAFPGSGITENLVDKAKARRIPVRRYGTGT